MRGELKSLRFKGLGFRELLMAAMLQTISMYNNWYAAIPRMFHSFVTLFKP